MTHGSIRRAKSLADLKRQYGVLAPGFKFVHRPLAYLATSIDLFVCPADRQPWSAYDLPEGSILVGIVEYPSYDSALSDMERAR